MTTASSGLSPEAKEFVPLVQNPTPSIPLYVDENTVASIYPSDQQPIMVQTIYPMMITNSKVTDISFPEIEFHIQPSQQQQFHIDSCTNVQQQTSTNGNTSSSNSSQIVLLPITNPATAVTLAGYYPEPPIIYSPNEHPVSAFYPIDYCEQPLINFSIQQPTSLTKPNRNSSQLQRPSSFRQHHGAYRPSSRGGNRGNGHYTNRNPYHDYSNNTNTINRRNGPSSHTTSSGRGNSTNSKRISSYHQNEYNSYYHHHSSTRSRGYLSRSTQQYDERRKDHYDYYNHDTDLQQIGRMSDDGTPFEFRPEDFPSLPMNNNNNNNNNHNNNNNNNSSSSQQSDKPSIVSTNTKATSSWNAIVSATRPRSTSPHSIPPSQDQRSDRSRSFNNKLSTTNERKSPNKKPIVQTATTTKSSNCASKTHFHDEQEASQQQPPYRSKSLTNNELSSNENNKDDGFIQTKQQQRRLKRKNKMKEEFTQFNESSNTNESAPYILDDENTFPTLGQEPTESIMNQNVEHDSNSELIIKSNPKGDLLKLTDMFDSLSVTTQVKQENSNHKTADAAKVHTNNSFDSKTVSKHGKEREQAKSRKSTKMKRIDHKDHEEIQKQQIESSSNVTVEIQSNEKDSQNETDTQTSTVIEINHQNSNPLSSTSNNSSDTSDYDDAVDNFDAE